MTEQSPIRSSSYRGRLAPSPTGFLHLGHAQTFWTAARRAAECGGVLILRNEDLDSARCRPEFVAAMYEDLRWLGITWTEGPDCGGPFGPYSQSERREHYLAAWRRLVEAGFIYPCSCSRRDVALAAGAPNEDDEPLYPGTCRPQRSFATPHRPFDFAQGGLGRLSLHDQKQTAEAAVARWASPEGVNWRFGVPEGEEICFDDLHLGPQRFVAGRDFGDFIVWRRDDVPAYQLAVVVDDAAMRIAEVVRGADLLKSTARQILLSQALGIAIPDYYHCDLVRDESGVRMAKRHDALSIRRLRESGWAAERVRG